MRDINYRQWFNILFSGYFVQTVCYLCSFCVHRRWDFLWGSLVLKMLNKKYAQLFFFFLFLCLLFLSSCTSALLQFPCTAEFSQSAPGRWWTLVQRVCWVLVKTKKRDLDSEVPNETRFITTNKNVSIESLSLFLNCWVYIAILGPFHCFHYFSLACSKNFQHHCRRLCSLRFWGILLIRSS